jgi:hypothetical protein
MKITIDTEAKTIEIEHPVKLADFIKEIKKILPDWKEYELSNIYSELAVPYYPVCSPIPTYPTYELRSSTGKIVFG